MRAHVVSAAPLALLYGLPESAPAFGVLRGMGFAVRGVEARQLSQPVGALAGLGGRARAAYSGPAPAESLLLMSGFSGGQVNGALEALRAADASVDYKAVVTRHNRHWTLLELMSELKRERASLERTEKDDS